MMKSQFQVLKEVALEMGIEIKLAKKRDYSKQGIHRLYPDLHDLQDALDIAERDGFKTIYIHTGKTWLGPR